MKLAEQLRNNKYKLPPLPKPPKPESEKARQVRKLKGAKEAFIKHLGKEIRIRKEVEGGRKLDFLDVPIYYYDFEDIFESYSQGQYRGDQFNAELSSPKETHHAE